MNIIHSSTPKRTERIAGDPLTDNIIGGLVAAILATEELQIRGEDIRFNEGNRAG